jgi:hypothetical protein
MRAPARLRRGELREQMCGVARLLLAWRTYPMIENWRRYRRGFLTYRTPENNGITSSSKAHACPNLYPKAIEN